MHNLGFHQLTVRAVISVCVTLLYLAQATVILDKRFNTLQQTSDSSNVIHANHLAAAPTESKTTICPGCERKKQSERLSSEQLKLLRLEFIKQQILQKLRLKHPPNVSHMETTNIPFVIGGDDEDTENFVHGYKNEDDFYGKIARVVLFANTVPNCPSDKPAACIQFTLKDQLRSKDITSAHVWIYNRHDPGDSRNQTIVISERTGTHFSKAPRTRTITTFKNANSRRGWVSFDIRNTVKRWLTKPMRNNGLEVKCKSCFEDRDDFPILLEGSIKPFLVINTKERHRRRKRETRDCRSSGGTCCREKLYVSFKDINWNFVLKPKGYHAYFCAGSCQGGVLPIRPRYNHTTVIHRVALRTPDTAIQDMLAPCCTPTKMSSQSLIYRDESGLIITKHLPNMIVDSCGCS